MKSIRKSAVLILVILITVFELKAQDHNSIALLSIDTKSITTSQDQLNNMVRLELGKLGKYSVMDKYDTRDKLKGTSFSVDECFGKQCLLSAGMDLGVAYMTGAGIERINNKIVLSFRIIEVKTGNIVYSDVSEYVYVESRLQTMIKFSLMKLHGIAVEDKIDAQMLTELTYSDNQNSADLPSHKTKNLNGPRMGMSYITGHAGQRLQDSEAIGGYDAFNTMTAFGYQFETQYISSGNFLALFEFLVMVNGLDQSMFMPSFTVLNGFRNSKNGWEVGFGPSFKISKYADGYIDIRDDGDGLWHLKNEWYANPDNFDVDNPNEIVSDIDKRGELKVVSSWVWAIGKTFRSGNLNIPVNAYFSPSKKGHVAGLSVGFNLSK